MLVELDGPERAQALAAELRAAPLPGMTAAVPGLRSVLVEVDPLARPASELTDELAARAAQVQPESFSARRRVIPVVYGGEYGPDLAEVAAGAGLTPDALVELHAATELPVLFLGFAPGFGYLGGLPERLHVARLATPRTRTLAGSVALAGEMCGIYPADLPGGWRVIGRTPVTLFDPLREPPAYLSPGDSVSWEPIDAAEWARRAGVAPDW